MLVGQSLPNLPESQNTNPAHHPVPVASRGGIHPWDESEAGHPQTPRGAAAETIDVLSEDRWVPNIKWIRRFFDVGEPGMVVRMSLKLKREEQAEARTIQISTGRHPIGVQPTCYPLN